LLLDKLKARINSWAASWLNLAEKVVLIKYVLSSILIYQFSILLAPSSTLNKFEIILQSFMWKGGKGNDKKLVLVSWGKIKKPLMEGGLQSDISTYKTLLLEPRSSNTW